MRLGKSNLKSWHVCVEATSQLFSLNGSTCALRGHSIRCHQLVIHLLEAAGETFLDELLANWRSVTAYLYQFVEQFLNNRW